MINAIIADTAVYGTNRAVNIASVTVLAVKGYTDVVIIDSDGLLSRRGCVERVGVCFVGLAWDDARVGKSSNEEGGEDQEQKEAVRNNNDPAEVYVCNYVWYDGR